MSADADDAECPLIAARMNLPILKNGHHQKGELLSLQDGGLMGTSKSQPILQFPKIQILLNIKLALPESI